MPAATMSDPNEFGRNRAFFESSRTKPAQKPVKKAAAAGSQPPRGPKNPINRSEELYRPKNPRAEELYGPKNPRGPKNPSEFKYPPVKGK